jgi:hypothetical protein
MSIEKRQYIRFSLDISGFRQADTGEEVEIVINQISVGGCLAEWDETIFTGDEFRMELALPNKNRLPLLGKAIYRFSGKGIGIKFQDITPFEQELLASIITERLENEGLPVMVDPFVQPPKYFDEGNGRRRQVPEEKLQEEALIDQVVATEG